ncbi:MAG: flagellar biosynthesis protein FlhA [Rhodobacterales bacterium RIFCSPHIGHO2_02_FULL_62_130]|jgi:flagellar biosynthesis protein FlhA|nr:MAG: flagellar biosynthesis protein FlhA [Rhodobacterales bacterium RIFCSPHIGHO2_02_FULL_62_130]OHC55990.1 MAG: flagellar biosynthesis protein FlhA [Rhodobacterales bacterium RIFCSPHIGHO2_12_FULL_62_75]
MSSAPTMGSLGRQAGGFVLPLGILAMLAMMILPLPTVLLDMFFVGNILFSLLILMVALHSYRPLDFSSFPSVLLFLTILRLALSVASTRMVLGDGHTGEAAAGKVIEAFGNVVIAGNFVVGLIVFTILVIINMIVITKGAGRVSEVSARFTLDAMPGKQMAIDADLSAGLMSPEDAKIRRAEVAAEADFYGSMDGASKFVKGDAIAGILILAINIIGGILIGTVQHGLSFAEAAETYVVLSVGDGLVAQIPALLLSIATAVIVTRSTTSSDMGAMIGKQLNIQRAWIPVAAVLAIIGVVPGMPNVMFLIAAAVAGAFAWMGSSAAKGGAKAASGPAPAGQSTGAVVPPAGTDSSADTDPGVTPDEVTDLAPLSLQIGYGLISLAGEGGGALVQRITGVRREVSKAMGFVVPGVRIRDDLALQPNQYRIRIGQTIVAEDSIHPERKLAIPGARSTRKLRGIEVKDPSFGLDAVWILPHQQAEAEADDQVVVEPESVIATHLGQILQKHAGSLIGPDEVQALLDALGNVAPTLVASVVPKLVPLHVLTSVLRALLAERIPVSDMRRILEGLANLAGKGLSAQDMAEALRPTLIPLLFQQLFPLSQALPLITLEPELEQILLRARRPNAEDTLMIDTKLGNLVLTGLAAAQEDAIAQGRQAMVVVAVGLRRALANYIRPHLPDVLVLGLNELTETRRVEVFRTIGGPASLPRMSPAAGSKPEAR